MVLRMFPRRPPDSYLFQTLRTERFELANCTWRETVRLTYPWARDPDILSAFAYDRSSYSRLAWAIRFPIPNGHSFFVHAVRPKGTAEVVGVHILRISPSGTVTLMMGLTDQAWSGKGVFEEVRRLLMDHFSRSDRVVRFSGRVLARNASSVYIYKKLGFRFVGYEKKAWRAPQTKELMDMMIFEYLAEDWRAARGLDPL